VSTVLTTLGLVLGGALLVAACVVAKHRYFPPPANEEPRDDVAEYISMMIGMVYALVLGLALVAVWDTHSNAEANVQTEASALHQVYLLSDALPPDAERQVRDTATAYAHHVTTVEWSAMAHRKPLGTAGWTMLNQIRDTYEKSASATPAAQNADQEAMSQMSSLDDARRGRETDAQDSLSGELWAGLFVGGLMTVVFMFIFGVQRRASHLVMVMGLTGFIVFLVLLIHQLDMPFGGTLSVDSDAFTRYFSSGG
jgi:hypothetical protein